MILDIKIAVDRFRLENLKFLWTQSLGDGIENTGRDLQVSMNKLEPLYISTYT